MSNQQNSEDLLQKIAALAKRRGFIYPGSDIYGGLANTYDYGPYGVELKKNIEKLWWSRFVHDEENMHGVDATVLLNPAIWHASGHVESFADIMVEDKKTHERYRADHIIEDHFAKKDEDIKVEGKEVEELQKIIEVENIKSPKGNELTSPRKFSTLFETEIGIIVGKKNKTYLRGEIAQGIFINYKNIVDSIHPKLPFGIAQMGKAFRNEITKGRLSFRTLEFDLMEFEYFFDPEEDKWEELFDNWKKKIYQFALEMGVREEKLRWREHEEFELSHYSKRTEDLEYEFPWGYKEMFACAYRTDFDLKNHQEKSGINLEYIKQDEHGVKRLIPHVVEPTFGLSRFVTILLMDAYREEMVDGKERVYLQFDPKVAPVKMAIFPLQKKPELEEVAKKLYEDVKEKTNYFITYDNTGNIGKNYRRQDEIGTPYCVTVDYDSLEDETVTVRERDSMEQKRIKISEVAKFLKDIIV